MARRSPSAPEWQVILEKIESQNRLTIEAVEMNRVVETRIDDLGHSLEGRFGNLDTAMATMIGQFESLETRVDGVDSRLGGLEARFVAREEVLDRRLSLIEASLERIDRESSRLSRSAPPEPYGRSTRKSYLSRGTGGAPGETPSSLT